MNYYQDIAIRMTSMRLLCYFETSSPTSCPENPNYLVSMGDIPINGMAVTDRGLMVFSLLEMQKNVLSQTQGSEPGGTLQKNVLSLGQRTRQGQARC